MVHSTDKAIDEKIINMRKEKFGLFRIHKWLIQWDNFSQLGEQVVLAHILNVLHKENLAVTKNEVKYTFNKYFNRDYHGNKQSYLKWLYGLVPVEKTPHRVVSETKEPQFRGISEQAKVGRGNTISQEEKNYVA